MPRTGPPPLFVSYMHKTDTALNFGNVVLTQEEQPRFRVTNEDDLEKVARSVARTTNTASQDIVILGFRRMEEPA